MIVEARYAKASILLWRRHGHCGRDPRGSAGQVNRIDSKTSHVLEIGDTPFQTQMPYAQAGGGGDMEIAYL
jgi:hypothetical protein